MVSKPSGVTMWHNDTYRETFTCILHRAALLLLWVLNKNFHCYDFVERRGITAVYIWILLNGINAIYKGSMMVTKRECCVAL